MIFINSNFLKMIVLAGDYKINVITNKWSLETTTKTGRHRKAKRVGN